MALAAPHTSASGLIACGARGGNDEDAHDRASLPQGVGTAHGGRWKMRRFCEADGGSVSNPDRELGASIWESWPYLSPSPAPVLARPEGSGNSRGRTSRDEGRPGRAGQPRRERSDNRYSRVTTVRRWTRGKRRAVGDTDSPGGERIRGG